MNTNNKRLLSEWAVGIGDIALRIVWTILVVACAIGLMKACNWADEGMRPEPQPARLGSERVWDINHGKP